MLAKTKDKSSGMEYEKVIRRYKKIMSKYSKELTQQGYYKDRYKDNREVMKKASLIRARKKRLLEIEKVCKEWDNNLRKYLSRKINI